MELITQVDSNQGQRGLLMQEYIEGRSNYENDINKANTLLQDSIYTLGEWKKEMQASNETNNQKLLEAFVSRTPLTQVESEAVLVRLSTSVATAEQVKMAETAL